MSEIASETLRAQVYDLKHEPARVGDLVLDLLESAVVDRAGFVMDPSQPLPFLLETSVVLTAAAVDSYETLTLQQYPNIAQTSEDLYLHLSDVDMVGMFGTPGQCYFTILLSKSEVVANAVAIDGSQSRKLTIPKHTQLTVNGLYFTMQYPIDIVIKPYGGIEITLDGTVSSPLQPLTGTRVDWNTFRQRSSVQGDLPNEYLRIRFPVMQMKLTSHVIKGNPTALLKKSFSLTDSFFYARAFRQTANGWVEIKTSHSEYTFDANNPTLMLKVVDSTLTVSLPHVYQLTSIASASIRVDIYTTRGDLYMDLAGLSASQFTANFADLDTPDNNRYIAPLETLDTFTILSDDAVSGGSNPPPFNVRRERVLNNAIGPIVQPISSDQVQTTVEKLGFAVSLNTDDASGRTFKVSRTMPSHVSGIITSPIDSAVLTAKSTMDDLVMLDTVVDNGDQITILPSTLYKNVDGALDIVLDGERTALETARSDIKVNMLIANNYLYTPLHYVMDPSNNQFNVRPYYLTHPTMDIIGYSASNETIDVFVQSSTTTQLQYTDTGYTLRILTESNAPYKALADSQVHAQLAFRPDIENEWVYVNGSIVATNLADERVFEFRIETSWEIDPTHNLRVTNFTLRQNTPQLHETPLKGEWFIIWLVSDYSIPGMTTSAVDTNVGRHLLPAGVVGIHQESMTIRLGDELSGLWRRSRPITGTISYKTYPYDIPKVYPGNVYEYGPDGSIIIEKVDGKKRLKVLHAKGSPMIDPDTGEPEVYPQGSPMVNEFGELIPLGPRTVSWWWDVVLFDAQYRYATRELDQTYTLGIADILNEWINDTLAPLKKLALERTEFQFQPINSLRYVNALVDDGETVSMYTAQKLVVDLYLTPQAYNRADLITAMKNTVQNVLDTEFAKTQLSIEGLNKAIKDTLGDDVITVSVSGLGGGDFSVITLLDTTTRLCLAKTLNVDTNGELSIISGLTINPKLHALQ